MIDKELNDLGNHLSNIETFLFIKFVTKMRGKCKDKLKKIRCYFFLLDVIDVSAQLFGTPLPLIIQTGCMFVKYILRFRDTGLYISDNFG